MRGREIQGDIGRYRLRVLGLLLVRVRVREIREIQGDIGRYRLHVLGLLLFRVRVRGRVR